MYVCSNVKILGNLRFLDFIVMYSLHYIVMYSQSLSNQEIVLEATIQLMSGAWLPL